MKELEKHITITNLTPRKAINLIKKFFNDEEWVVEVECPLYFTKKTITTSSFEYDFCDEFRKQIKKNEDKVILLKNINSKDGGNGYYEKSVYILNKETGKYQIDSLETNIWDIDSDYYFNYIIELFDFYNKDAYKNVYLYYKF